jgi:o-succinylbenzoate---CoA ligase
MASMSASLALHERALATPTATALESGDLTIDFRTLAARAASRAAEIAAPADPASAPVAVLLDGGLAHAEWIWAAACAGRPLLPVHARLTAGEIVEVLRRAAADTLVVDSGDPRLPAISAALAGARIVGPDTDGKGSGSGGLDGRPCDEPLSPRGRGAGERGHGLPVLQPVAPDTQTHITGSGHPDAPSTTHVILPTSGTSGTPKLACLSWPAIAASALASAERLGDAAHGRWLCCLPLYHVGGLSLLWRSVVLGGPVRLLPRFDAAAVVEELARGDIAGLSLVPTMLRRLLAAWGERAAPAGLRAVLLGGAAADPELVDRALACGWPLCPTYGLTEAASQVATAAPPGPGARQPEPMRALPGTDLRIALDGRDAAPGEAGEILARGPTLMTGYLGDPAASARALEGGWLHTGDIGVLDADGGLSVLDRRDDLIVSGGENVYPAEVEAVLLAHPQVADAGVMGVPDPDLGARVEAWIVPAPGVTLDDVSLDAHCRARLAGHKRPRGWHLVEALPRNAAGKLLRRRLASGGRES